MGIRRSSRCSCMDTQRNRLEAHTSLSNFLAESETAETVARASVLGSWVLGSLAPVLGSDLVVSEKSRRYGRVSSQTWSQSNRKPS